MESNDSAIRRAAVRLLAQRGWRSMTTTEVGLQAGLTHGAVYERFRNKEQLALTVWQEELEPLLTQALRILWASAREDPAELQASLNVFWHPTTSMVAAVELLLAAEFEMSLQAQVRGPIAALISECAEPERDQVAAVIETTMAIAALGLVMSADRPWVSGTTSAFPAGWLAAGLTGLDLNLPGGDVLPVYLLEPGIDSGDERVDRIMEATVAVVGARGYDNAYLRDIAMRAGMSTRAVTRTFGHKVDLMAATLGWQHRRGLAGLDDYLQRAGKEIGPGAAEAAAWRWYLSPQLADARTMLIEANRLQVTEASVRAAMVPAEQEMIDHYVAQRPATDAGNARAAIHLEFALGLGLLAVARLAPDAHRLPFHALTIPMHHYHPWSGADLTA